MASRLTKRLDAAHEFYLMVRERKAWVLAPIVIAITAIMLFSAAAEMPVLIPFFYAVF